MYELALAAGGILVLTAMLAVAAMRRPAADWSKAARNHQIYTNLHDEEIESVDSREAFVNAMETSVERHYLSKPVTRKAMKGEYTRNELYDDIVADVRKRAGDVLLPGEVQEIVDRAYDRIAGTWERGIKKKEQG
ncbi:MAG: hypothetical protein QXU82_00235 [Candidatus Aenigmatarchaeota archaeon]